jgi:RNA:NAD 2'-phosphotransferase (TPT1/KptA family)
MQTNCINKIFQIQSAIISLIKNKNSILKNYMNNDGWCFVDILYYNIKISCQWHEYLTILLILSQPNNPTNEILFEINKKSYERWMVRSIDYEKSNIEFRHLIKSYFESNQQRPYLINSQITPELINTILQNIEGPLKYRTNNFSKYMNNLSWCYIDTLYRKVKPPCSEIIFQEILNIISNPKYSINVQYELNKSDHTIRSVKDHSIEIISDEDKNILLVHGTKLQYLESIEKHGLIKRRSCMSFIIVGAPIMRRYFDEIRSDTYLYTTIGNLLDNNFQIWRGRNHEIYVNTDVIPYELLWQLENLPWDL